MKKFIPPILALSLIGGYYTYKYFKVEPNVITGMVEVKSSKLGSKIGGRVISINFEEGMSVKKGDVLINLDDRIEKEQFEIAQITLKESANRAQNIRVAQSQFDIAKLNFDETKIIAPYDGIIDTIAVQKGDMIAPNQSVVEIRKDYEFEINGYLPSTKLQSVALGDILSFTTDFDTTPHDAKVVSISSKTEFIPKSVSTKEDRELWIYKIKLIPLDKSQEFIKSGMYVEITLDKKNGNN